MKRLVNLWPPRISGSASPVAISSYACASGSGSSAVFVVVPTSSSSVAFGAAAKSFSAVVIVFSVLMVNPYYAISVVLFVVICVCGCVCGCVPLSGVFFAKNQASDHIGFVAGDHTHARCHQTSTRHRSGFAIAAEVEIL